MGREAKLGLIFIGILLTVFSALLIKRLTKHPNLPPTSLNAMATKSPDSTSFAHTPPPALPTVVTPQDDNARPPEYSMNNRESLRRNSGVWSNSTSPVKTELTRDTVPSASQPPSLLAEPLPVTDAGGRYSTKTPDETSSRLPPETKQLASDTVMQPTAPQPYRSGYSTASDDARTTSAPVTPPVQVQPVQVQPVADPFPRIKTAEVPGRTNFLSGNELPVSQRAGNSAVASSVDTGNANGNEWQAMPTSSASALPNSTVSTGTAMGGNDRYSPPPMPRANGPMPIASPDYTQRTNEYLPRNNIASDFPARQNPMGDFNQRDGMGAVTQTASIPLGIQRNGDQYTVQPNDSFWIISERAYGVGGYFKALFELNRKRTKDSEDLKVGEVLTVPEEAVLRRMYPDLCPKPHKQTPSLQQRTATATSKLQGAGRIYTVVEGDTLFEIARHELGKPSRWGEIYELNRDALGDDFDYLRPGTQLILPDRPSGSSDLHGNTASRQPDPFYPR